MKTALQNHIKVHNFTQLMILSGLLAEHNVMMNDPNFRNDWSVLCLWKESLRYECGKTETDAGIFIASVKSYILWIKKFL
jgi:hypothetical protein